MIKWCESNWEKKVVPELIEEAERRGSFVGKNLTEELRIRQEAVAEMFPDSLLQGDSGTTETLLSSLL